MTTLESPPRSRAFRKELAPGKAGAMAAVPIGAALRRVFAKGYGIADLRSDVLAGAVVGIVALPLSMALAIAVGTPPQHGLYTAIVAGAVVALLGGCKFQVTGPTAAFVVILAPIVAKHGIGGLLTAGLLAGLLLIAMGLARLGSLIQYIPYPVTTGFTTGIATVIATLQIKDVFGLLPDSMPEHYVDKVAALWRARGTAHAGEFGVAAVTLALLLLIPRIIEKVPAPLIAIGGAALVSALLHAAYPAFAVATIGSRFHTVVGGVEIAGIPSVLPSPSLPWGTGGLTFGLVHDLLPAALAIAMLGAIESLLSAVIADGMTHTRHDPNTELVALGVGNVVAPIFGGIAATGALARTATNIRAGARSPFASVTHAAVVLLAMLALGRWMAYVPMASLAALLLLVAWNMSEVHSFVGIIKVAPKSDVFVLVTCFLLTVFFDMVVAVSTGFVLAAILFMRRMAELTQSRLELDATREGGKVALPEGVMLYAINGPLFFGGAQKAMGALHSVQGDSFRVLIIDLGRVPVIDATGLVALENAMARVLRWKKKVVLAGPLPKPRRIFDKAKLETKYMGLAITPDLDAAIALSGGLALEPPIQN
ncbi:C4-dicarboxylic acid transporter DauA [Pendulispora albinea]|uniref:C4-dicarboxylic acid transporter DauA n=1 Tax=Pendulispora albinea TaxID=2741071 RepID=A0ABZ2M2Z3_9BACT